jgi:ATP adenylyltransferase
MEDESNGVKGFDKLWAPWRMKYIDGIGVTGDSGCIFCVKPGEDSDESNFIIHRGEHCFVILNIFPYNNGHLLIVPYKHTCDFEELGPETLLEMNLFAAIAIRAMKKTMRPDGFNMGMNLGRSAGAGIAEHLHLHLVPRWNGDTNFMPVVGGTKVISESLEGTYAKIKKAFGECTSAEQ